MILIACIQINYNFIILNPKNNNKKTFYINQIQKNWSIIFQQLMRNQQSSNKLINADNIYPKRLGTYQNGNALVLEYYNLELDKFKKHVIPLDHTKDVKQNLNSILKNQKHALLLRKIDSKYLEAAIKGENSNYNRNRILQEDNLNSFNEKQISYQNSNGNISNSNISRSHTNLNSHKVSSSYPSPLLISSQNHSSQNQSQQQNEISIIQISKPTLQNNKIKEKIQQIQEYYQEEFEEFEISQSLGKNNTININKNGDKNFQKGDNESVSQTTQPLISKYQEKENITQIQQPKKKKDKTKKSKKKQSIVEDQFQFDFLDDGDKPKQKTKSKQKSKQKSVSKQKKQKKQKKQQKQVKTQKQNPKKPVVVESIQDQFQFL